MFKSLYTIRLKPALVLCVLCAGVMSTNLLSANDNRLEINGIIERTQAKMAKIYGAGGMRGLESYQSGILVSSEGHILTAYSHVLDTDYITVYLADGRKFEAKLLGADPRLDIAVLKINTTGLKFFDLTSATKADYGDNVLALSNLFNVALGDEPSSVQHGVISAVTKLGARRGAYETPYNGIVYVLDVKTNNPGSAGGALVNRHGELLAMLGKELRNSRNNTWLSYAMPIEVIRPSVEAIRSGKFVADREAGSAAKPQQPLTLDMLGIVLVPDVLERTPPFVELVRTGSPAEKAGIKPDDLIVLLGDRLVQSCKLLGDDLQYIDALDKIRITVLRGTEMLEFDLPGAADKKETP